MVFILHMFFVSELQSYGNTMQLNEWACLQWNLGRYTQEEGGTGNQLAVGWLPKGLWVGGEN